jgi:DNA modification methylase
MMGVATTGVASLNLNRQFIGIEKDAETFKIAKARLGSISLAGVTTGTNFLAA